VAIDRLLGDRDLAGRLGSAARDTARETFTLERTVEGTIALYQGLVGQAKLSPAS
jgi:hypothetical protein